MLKTEFIERVRKMQNPQLVEDDPGYFDDLIATQWSVHEGVKGSRERFWTPAVKLQNREHLKPDGMDAYYSRVDKARRKYERWFAEATQ